MVTIVESSAPSSSDLVYAGYASSRGVGASEPECLKAVVARMQQSKFRRDFAITRYRFGDRDVFVDNSDWYSTLSSALSSGKGMPPVMKRCKAPTMRRPPRFLTPPVEEAIGDSGSLLDPVKEPIWLAFESSYTAYTSYASSGKVLPCAEFRAVYVPCSEVKPDSFGNCWLRELKPVTVFALEQSDNYDGIFKNAFLTELASIRGPKCILLCEDVSRIEEVFHAR